MIWNFAFFLQILQIYDQIVCAKCYWKCAKDVTLDCEYTVKKEFLNIWIFDGPNKT